MIRRLFIGIFIILLMCSLLIGGSQELKAEPLNFRNLSTFKIYDKYFENSRNINKNTKYFEGEKPIRLPNADEFPKFDAYNQDIASHGFNMGRKTGYQFGKGIKDLTCFSFDLRCY